jgi:hypothetical protein
MCVKKVLNRPHLEQQCRFTDMSDYDHKNNDINFVIHQMKYYRVKWKVCKKWSMIIRPKLSTKQAEMMALKLQTSHKKAIKAIKKGEESRWTFQTIRELLAKNKKPLTQVDVLSDPNIINSSHITLNQKIDIETAILQRNR